MLEYTPLSTPSPSKLPAVSASYVSKAAVKPFVSTEVEWPSSERIQDEPKKDNHKIPSLHLSIEMQRAALTSPEVNGEGDLSCETTRITDCDQRKLIRESFKELSRLGVRQIPISQLRLGSIIDKGSFGVVREAIWNEPGAIPRKVAMKTSTRDDDFEEVLELFKLEAKMAWMASTRARSLPDRDLAHIVCVFGVAYTAGMRGRSPQLVLHHLSPLLL